MATKFKISIKKPCDAKLQEMQKTDAGFFCNLCSKTVHDFRTSNKKDICSTLEKSNYSICGIYNTKHINQFSKLRLPLKFISILGLIFSKEAFAQEKPTPNNNSNNTIENGNIPENRVIMGKIARNRNKENMYNIMIDGILINNTTENKTDFNNLSLYMYGATQDAQLDKNGKFKTQIEIEKQFTNLYAVLTFNQKKYHKNNSF